MFAASHRRAVSRRRSGPRALPLIGVIGLALLPLIVGPVQRAAADGSAVTVDAPAGGTVTVDKTVGLVNEVVRVSWSGFRPSYRANGATIFSAADTWFPVSVRECRGSNPAAPSECYGSYVYDYPGRPSNYNDGFLHPNGLVSQPDGPSNGRNAATSADGTGQVDIELRTSIESSTLGCSTTVECSIVVIPNYGDPTSTSTRTGYEGLPACASIQETSGDSCASADNPPANGIVWQEDSIDAPWAWDNRVVIPVSFAPAADSCPFAGDADVSTLGAAQLGRLFERWQPAVCNNADPFKVDYTAQGETAARASFLSGLADIGLTQRPADVATRSDGSPFTYAPIATSGITVAFHADDQVTGLPIESMKLNPRLVAKLITESYGWAGSYCDCGGAGDPAVAGNPQTMFTDPEFLELNPGHTWVEDSGATPLLVADLSDLTWAVTSYVTSDPGARAFLDGQKDAWGMHVNTTYTQIAYPSDGFDLRDQYDRMLFAFQTTQGLKTVASKLVNDAYAGVQKDLTNTGSHVKFGTNGDGYQVPGSRAFVAIIDTGNAAAFAFPTAALLNSAGSYVLPTSESMEAAVTAMTVNPDGITRSPDYHATDAAAYPMTTVDYAMVQTQGLDPAKAEATGKLLDYAAGDGQTPAGLPNGYTPLNAALTDQTRTAAGLVRAQQGNAPPTDAPPSPPPTTPGGQSPVSGSGSGGGFPSISGGGTPSVGAPANTGVAPTSTTTAATSSPVAGPALGGPSQPASSQTPGWFRFLLPVVLAVGLGAAVFGSAGSWLAGQERVPAFLRKRRPSPSEPG